MLVVLGRPVLPPRAAQGDRRIQNGAGWRVSAFQGRRIDDRLERRTWLAQRLGRPVEAGQRERIATHHGRDPPREGLHRHERAVDRRHLLQTKPRPVLVRRHEDQIARANPASSPGPGDV